MAILTHGLTQLEVGNITARPVLNGDMAIIDLNRIFIYTTANRGVPSTWSPASAAPTQTAGRFLYDSLGRKLYNDTGAADVRIGGFEETGTGVLAAGVAVVPSAFVVAGSLIWVTARPPIVAPGALYVAAIVAGVSFTVTSTSVIDASAFAYRVYNP